MKSRITVTAVLEDESRLKKTIWFDMDKSEEKRIMEEFSKFVEKLFQAEGYFDLEIS